MSVAINSLLNHSGSSISAAEGWVQGQRQQYQEEAQHTGHQVQYRQPPGEQDRSNGIPPQFRYQQHSQHGQQVLLPSPPSTAGGTGRSPPAPAAPVPILSTTKNSVCEKCGEGFQCDSLRRKHEARHTKPYKCPLRSCQRSTTGFTSKNDLSRHLNSVHKGQAAVGYNCKYGNCRDKKKIYYRLDNFRNHLKKLHGSANGGTEAEFIKRAELECRTEDTGSSLELSGAETSDALNLAAQSDAESVAGGRNTPARSNPQPCPTPLANSPEHSMKLNGGYPPTVFKPWKQEPPSPPRTGTTTVSQERVSEGVSEVDTSAPQRIIPQSADRAEKRRRLVEKMREIQMELQLLDEQDAREFNEVGVNGMARSPDLSPEDKGYGIAKYPGQNGQTETLVYGIPLPRKAHLEPGSLTHPDGSQSHSLSHHGREMRFQPHAPGFEKDRNGAEISASSTLPSPSETVGSTGNWTPAGGHDANPLSPPLAHSPLLMQARRGAPGPLLINNGILKQGLTLQDIPTVTRLNREAGTRTFHCPHPGCKSKFHRECELRKHRRRHTRPYECTVAHCKSVFGSKNDWKRHENSQHHRLEMWKCQIPLTDDGTEVCGKVCFRKENFMNHLKAATGHGITEKSMQEQWAQRCYLSGNGDDTFWCGFCQDPNTGKKGVMIKLKNVGEGKKGPDRLDERYDHMAAHFENNLTMKSFVHPTHDHFTDDSSSISDEEFDMLNSTSLSGQGREPVSPIALEQLADVAASKRRAGYNNYGDRDGHRKKQRVEGNVWYCCDPKREHSGVGFSAPNLIDDLRCLDCNHERCRNCETGIPEPHMLRDDIASPKMIPHHGHHHQHHQHHHQFRGEKRELLNIHIGLSGSGMNGGVSGPYQR
ncbi:hypothetical protein EX30DRAFT_366347 [Ascodesmis nigricans]|uniref:C2H2-type domain-containing protein n=1 Tax=Ascodesmis nigricans TaxID=341454 RepID=A0A4S2MRU7_9PEZI|nr:hypothetical protein EX30DRAFT_366347 [Ascodesmis nigricans]